MQCQDSILILIYYSRVSRSYKCVAESMANNLFEYRNVYQNILRGDLYFFLHMLPLLFCAARCKHHICYNYQMSKLLFLPRSTWVKSSFSYTTSFITMSCSFVYVNFFAHIGSKVISNIKVGCLQIDQRVDIGLFFKCTCIIN